LCIAVTFGIRKWIFVAGQNAWHAECNVGLQFLPVLSITDFAPPGPTVKDYLLLSIYLLLLLLLRLSIIRIPVVLCLLNDKNSVVLSILYIIQYIFPDL